VTCMVLSAEDTPYVLFCYCDAVDDWNSAGHMIHRLCVSYLHVSFGLGC
jgi:hypothetical protein